MLLWRLLVPYRTRTAHANMLAISVVTIYICQKGFFTQTGSNFPQSRRSKCKWLELSDVWTIAWKNSRHVIVPCVGEQTGQEMNLWKERLFFINLNLNWQREFSGHCSQLHKVLYHSLFKNEHSVKTKLAVGFNYKCCLPFLFVVF